MHCEKEFIYKTHNGQDVYKYILTNSCGMKVALSNYGATILSVLVKDKYGQTDDVVLGYDRIEDYDHNIANFGGVIGRCANRIRDGRFTLNGVSYDLDRGYRGHCLHSGKDSYNFRVWEEAAYDSDSSCVEFVLKSPHLDQGFPGNLVLYVRYELNDEGALLIKYHGKSDMDTVLNLTNHSYFNMAGKGNVLSQKVYINSGKITEIDENTFPTGKYIDVSGTPFDFRQETCIGENMKIHHHQFDITNCFDHNYVLNTKRDQVSLVASMYDENSGRKMEVYTNMPGMQFYVAGFYPSVPPVKGGKSYEEFSGACFETGYFPDAINIENFEKPVIRADVPFSMTTIYKFETK